MNHTIHECMEQFEVRNYVFIPIAVCVAGQYLDEGNRCIVVMSVPSKTHPSTKRLTAKTVQVCSLNPNYNYFQLWKEIMAFLSGTETPWNKSMTLDLILHGTGVMGWTAWTFSGEIMSYRRLSFNKIVLFNIHRWRHNWKYNGRNGSDDQGAMWSVRIIFGLNSLNVPFIKTVSNLLIRAETITTGGFLNPISSKKCFCQNEIPETNEFSK